MVRARGQGHATEFQRSGSIIPVQHTSVVRMYELSWPPLRWSLLSLCVACGASSSQAKAPSEQPPPARAGDGTAIINSRTAAVPRAVASERIVFLRSGSVWMMGPDGEDPEQLTVRSLEAADQSPRLSPDGTLLAYASAKDGTLRVYLQNMDDLIPMPIGDGPDGEASFSPDGKTLAFLRGDESVNRDLYLLDLQDPDATPRLLLKGDDDHPSLAGGPIFTRDGRSILMAADRREHQGTTLWRIDIASGKLQRLTAAPNDGADWICDRSPTLSPDGKRVAFISNRHGASSDDADDFDLYTANLDGSGLTRLSDDPGTVAEPAYSSDGKRLYFASTRIRQADYEWEIFVMASGGGEQRRLTRDARPENRAPSVTTLPASK